MREISRIAAFLAALLMASAPIAIAEAQDADAGERLFRQRCGSCHSLEAGQNRVGPSLAGIIGRQAGTAEGARYSNAMQSSDITWTAEQIETFITNPRQLVRGTTMSMAIRNERDRKDIVAFLEQIGQGN